MTIKTWLGAIIIIFFLVIAIATIFSVEKKFDSDIGAIESSVTKSRSALYDEEYR